MAAPTPIRLPMTRLPRWTLAAPLLSLAAGLLTGPRPANGRQPPSAPQDSVSATRARYVADVRAQIAGRENARADSVFRDLRILGALRAGLIPIVMDQGFARSLGVGCGHCHVVGDWSRPDSAAFEITREMYAMTRRINEELLRSIPGIRDRRPEVTCSTCHRGNTVPATRI